MKPVRIQTSRRFVWMVLAVAKLTTLRSGSGPRYLARLTKPKATCRPNNSTAARK
jgi:hypothetical protein